MPGFKKTPAGWIPQHWECIRAGDLFDVQLGKMVSKNARTGTNPQPYLANHNVRWGKFELTSVPKMDFYEKEIARYQLQNGDLLVCEGGEVGRCAVWKEQIKPCYYQKALHRLRPTGKQIDIFYAMHYFHYAALSPHMVYYTGQTSISHLTREQLVKFPIVLPPLSEQRKIAEILTTWDHAVDQTNRLIDAQSRRKAALQEQLMTGIRRFPVFGRPIQNEAGLPEGWRKVKLGCMVSRLCNGMVYDTQHAAGLPVTRIETISNGRIDMSKTGRVPAKAATAEYRIQKGDILYSHINSLPQIGKAALFDADDILFHGMNLLLIRADSRQCLPQYLLYLLNGSAGKRQALRFAKKAINQVSINACDLKQMEFVIPGLAEQRQIVDLLVSADEQITLLGKKCRALAKQKSGLMQELFAGRLHAG